MVRGADRILEHLEFDRLLAECDVCITGEGRVDGQTSSGKACAAVLERASAINKPVLLVAGGRTNDADEILERTAAWAVLCEDEAAAVAREIGFPVLIKATAGGGGKGMRRVEGPEALAAAYRAARSEARASFADDRVYIEKFLVRPRHIEIQAVSYTHLTLPTIYSV